MSEAKGSNDCDVPPCAIDEEVAAVVVVVVGIVDEGGPLEVMLNEGADGMMGGGLLAGSSDGLFSCHDYCDSHDDDDDDDDDGEDDSQNDDEL